MQVRPRLDFSLLNMRILHVLLEMPSDRQLPSAIDLVQSLQYVVSMSVRA